MEYDMEVTLIIPCYNEETNIQKGVLDKIGNYTSSDNRFKTVLIVDDGSTDSSISIIKKKYLKLFPKFKLLENPHQGKAFAIIRGMESAETDYVMFSDIDLATPIEEAEKLMKKARDGADIVVGSRSNRREGAPLLRKLMSVGAVIVKNNLLGLSSVKDTQCGFKLFNRKKVLEVIHRLKVFKKAGNFQIHGSSVSAGFDLELLYVASKMSLKIIEVPVLWRHVETKNVHFLNDTIQSLKDIIRIRLNDMKGFYN